MNEWVVPGVDLNKCTGCGRCVTLCPTQAVDFVDEKPVIARPEQCTYCGTCEEICPVGAIALRYEIVFGSSSSNQT